MLALSKSAQQPFLLAKFSAPVVQRGLPVHLQKERKSIMKTKKFQGFVVLKNGIQVRPVIETANLNQARSILEGQYPDARSIFVNEIR